VLTQARLLSVTQSASVQQVRRDTTGFLFDVGTLNNGTISHVNKWLTNTRWRH